MIVSVCSSNQENLFNEQVLSFKLCLFKTSQESLGPHLHLEASVSIFDLSPPIGDDLIFQLREFLRCHYDHYSFIRGSHLSIMHTVHTHAVKSWVAGGGVGNCGIS